MLHFLLYVLLCCAPLLVLLPVWRLDGEPDNQTVHESGDGDAGNAEAAAA